ncbi:MAG: helix-turn-helix domain-containing protein [Solirubrobacterales bacterium]
MAPQVGQALREARTERGIELSEVERATYIRIRFLRAMEEDRWEALPAPAYARGFLSTYARFLGLDDQALVDEYRRSAEGVDRAEPIPYTVLQRGVLGRRRSIKPVAMLFTGLVAAVVLGLVIVGPLGGSENGGDVADQRGGTEAGSAAMTTTNGERPVAPAGQLPTAQASEVSLELRSTGTVWVCLVNDEDRAPVNGETLTADEVRGPFDSRAFEVTFGNGSVEMTVDGEPTEIPPVAEPLGYRITPSGVRKLDPSSQPTCL